MRTCAYIIQRNCPSQGKSHHVVGQSAGYSRTTASACAVAGQLRDRLSTTAQAQIILVTSALHMRRARGLCARAGFQVIPCPVDCRVAAGRACTILDLLPEANSLRQTDIALRAWYGCLYDQLMGRGTEAGSTSHATVQPSGMEKIFRIHSAYPQPRREAGHPDDQLTQNM